MDIYTFGYRRQGIEPMVKKFQGLVVRRHREAGDRRAQETTDLDVQSLEGRINADEGFRDLVKYFQNCHLPLQHLYKKVLTFPCLYCRLL